MATPPTQTVNEAISRPDDDLCLAYANTRYWRGTTAPTEDLNDLDDLLRWAASAEQLPQPLIDRFGAYWRGSPDEAATSFRDAIALREAIFRSFAATAAGRAPPEADLTTLNEALAAAPARRRLRLGGWEIGMPVPSASALLAPTLWSAADLL